jgi:hypothetical protein
MKITRKQLRQIIKEELSRLDESISVNTMETLESVLSIAYKEGRASYRSDQTSYDGDRVHPDPHTEVVNQLLGLAREYLDDVSDDDREDPAYASQFGSHEDDDYPKTLGYTHPETGEQVMIMVQTSDDMDDILDPLLRQYPDLPYSID